MSEVLFKYRVHPGDFFRNAEIAKLPDPENDLEGFLIWFLDDYQSDERIAYINDLCMVLENQQVTPVLLNEKTFYSNAEIQAEIAEVETQLKDEAYRNFYHLLRENKIQIIGRDEE
ncbi:hypothetical protein [Flavobacterium sp.]|uniref:hypothetical protein n=1 Tax=Flavobacterium sp. TaxID=239 RepID=UPI003B9B7007